MTRLEKFLKYFCGTIGFLGFFVLLGTAGAMDYDPSFSLIRAMIQMAIGLGMMVLGVFGNACVEATIAKRKSGKRRRPRLEVY